MMWHLADARFSIEWRFIQQSHHAGCIVNPSLWICVTSTFPRSIQAVFTRVHVGIVLNQSFFSFFANKSKLSFESSLTQGAAKQPINNSSSQRQRHSYSVTAAHLLICGHAIDPQPQYKLEKRCLWAAFFPLSSIEEEVFQKKEKKTVILSFKALFLKEHRERTVSCLTVLLLCFFSKVFLQKEQDFLHTLIQRVNVQRQSTAVRRGASISCYRKCVHGVGWA